MNQIYDVNYFIRKFEAIPEDRWCINLFKNSRGQCCARGHCGVRVRPFGVRTRTEEDMALLSIDPWIADTNNGHCLRYQQPTPKQRILAALYDKRTEDQVEISDLPVTVEDLIGEEVPVL